MSVYGLGTQRVEMHGPYTRVSKNAPVYTGGKYGPYGRMDGPYVHVVRIGLKIGMVHSTCG